MNEDAPGDAKPFTQAGMVTIECVIKCGDRSKVPAFEDKFEQNKAKRIKPIGAAGPYICLSCWRAGWRSEGPFNSQPTGDYWRVYNLDGTEFKPWKP